jgi:hypothetical protein
MASRLLASPIHHRRKVVLMLSFLGICLFLFILWCIIEGIGKKGEK